MEAERRIQEAFVTLNAHRVPTTDNPVAHLAFYRGGGTMPDEILAFDRDDILNEMDAESELVRWLLNQMNTYDCTKQRIIGVVFDKKTVLSDVLRQCT